ncbi:non-ribosomal peptide synthetase [Chitinophaga rhizophila]|uniref:AMP-binding protein n=1 Tax=Chitinophaga rhizophila TaxID=2866212 RepID=A0ABS7GIB5_9BACT|nr:condensation domain-containing protein [Chitinophaga rhizophila]MBW8687171.1 AMP-binding protein [Chitinophaga rhizophila]
MKLTLPQQDVYFEQLLYPDEPIYNIGAKILIRGKIVPEIMNRAYIALIDQHDTYRSIIVQQGDEVHMQVLDSHDTVLEYVDFSRMPDADLKANDFMQTRFRKVFSFEDKQFLHKFMLIKVAEEVHYLFSMYHHIITDGWGTSLLFQRLVKNYNELLALAKQQPCEVYTYADFGQDDDVYQVSADFEADKTYWTSRFRALPERLFTKIAPNVFVNNSSRRELIVPRPLYNQLEALAQQQKATTFHVVLAVLYMYFGRKHQQYDFAVGLPVLNRGKSAFKKTVGLFMGVSALRIQFSPHDTFTSLVSAIKQQLRQDYRHQRFPLGKLIKELDAFTSKDRLFNMTLSYEKQNYADHFAGTETRVVPLTHGAERVALALYIREFDAAEDVKIDFDYHTNYFTEADIRDVVGHFEQLLQQVCQDPGKQLLSYEYLTPAEKQQLLIENNHTAIPYPADATLLSLFARQVKERPDAPAVSDSTTAWTYKELDTLSDRMAMRLRTSSRIGKECPVAVLMPRSARLVAVLLGVLKAGNAFIPLDPEFPQARLDYIISHSNVRCIEDIETGDEVITGLPEVPADATAYIIYTSGSTGNPKGVEIGHRSLLNFLLSMAQRPGLSAGDTLFSVTTQSFDISILEFFAPLVTGAHVYVADRQLLADPQLLLNELQQVNPRIIQATPSFYQFLFDAGWKGSNHLKVLCGGDLLSAALAEKLLTSCREVWNMYGPTETTIWSGVKHILSPEDACNIGSPINNTRFYILDEHLQPLPAHCPGALYIGGDGLAKGYAGNKELTAQRFIDDPFVPGGRMYETGDLGYWNRKGEVIFLGRNDHQVKIRGYRIELGEIEARLNQLPAISASVVIARKKEACLAAYIIPAADTFDAGQVLAALREELPEYMIPAFVIPVTAFPLTPNNKVDRKALASLELESTVVEHTYQAPATLTEKSLCQIFKEALDWEGQVSIRDSFFSLGGHSLNAVKVVNLVQQQLSSRITLKDLFEAPAVQQLAIRVQQAGKHSAKGITPAPVLPNYPLAPAQYAIWLAAQHGPEMSAAYNVSVVYQVKGDLSIPQLEQAFNCLISKYEILRTNFFEQEGEPRQQVKERDEIYFRITTTSDIAAFLNQPFDLDNDLLIRVAVTDSPEGAYLAFCSHHIILDGWSMGLLVREISRLYQAVAPASELPALQYKDYVYWQQQYPAEKNERFWSSYLHEYHWSPLLPVTAGLVAQEGYNADYLFSWSSDCYKALKETASLHRQSVHTMLVSTFIMLLNKGYKHNDICIGTVNSGRAVAALHDQPGMFVRTLPLRCRILPGQTCASLIEAIHTDMLELDTHQDIPSHLNTPDILFVLQPPAFNYDNFSPAEGVELALQHMPPRFSRMPLLINCIEAADGLRCVVSYDTGRYDSTTIEMLFGRYQQLLTTVIADMTVTIDSLDIALAFEKEETIDIDFDF